MRNFLQILPLLAALVPFQSHAEKPLSDYIRPFVGTQGQGNTFPGPAAPWGMVQEGPDTADDLWDNAAGYKYSDKSIMGFSMTHLSGTGIPDRGDFLFIPQIGEPKIVPGPTNNPDAGYRARFSHDDETASAGYYKVKLLNNNVTVELTATERAGLMRFTFPESDQASILTDLSHFLNGAIDAPGRFKMIWSHVRVEDDSTVTGFHLVGGWAKERYVYFAARYSRPFDSHVIYSSGKEVKYDTYRFRSRNEAAGTNIQFIAKYKTHANEAIQVKVSVSPVSAANALENLDKEIPDWNFERVRKETCAAWDRELGRVQIEGSQWDKETFYTGMYHCFLAPSLYEDSDGEYRGLDSTVRFAQGFTNYTVFSLWDTYRATHPLLALIESKRDADMINSLLAHYDQSVDHLLPVWSLEGNETWCMVGYHAVPVIVDGYLKGVKGIDAKHAYEAIKNTAMNPDYDSVMTYAKLGWVPFDLENENVSKTLEYAYDDYCVAQMAKALGKKDDYEYFMKRSENFTNLYDPSIGLMRPRDSKGNWRTPFEPHAYNDDSRTNDFTEGTSWQYSWYAPQDVPELMKLSGGKEPFAAKLDQLFNFKPDATVKGLDDVQGRIGEYWHGNEPSHHIIYLYCYAGQPWKAAERVHEVIRTQYGNKPNSLSGNDDCGQMSAWYIFSAIGFYPVCPASDYYVIGSPCVPKATMHLSNGHTFTMTANNLSDTNIYVQSAKLDGKPLNTPFLLDKDVRKGGTLEFQMGPQPNKSWGANAAIPE